MPILVSEMIDKAALRLNDPNKGKLSPETWTMFYNDATEEMTRDYKVLDVYATHDIAINADEYSLPEDCVQMKKWFYATDDPVSPTTFYQEAGELFEDEFADAIRYALPIGDTGFRYFARAKSFRITPVPSKTVVAGGRIEYWKLRTEVSPAAIGSTQFELPASLNLLTRQLMQILAKENLHRYEEAAHDRAVWTRAIEKVADRIEDRSDNRRPRFRLRSARRGYSGMN